MKPPLPSERELHSSIVQWVSYALPNVIIHHAMNEGKRSRGEQRWFRESGAVTGWPDLEVLYKGRTLFLELKVGNRQATTTQAIVLMRLAKAGFWIGTARSFDDAQAHILQFVRAVGGERE